VSKHLDRLDRHALVLTASAPSGHVEVATELARRLQGAGLGALVTDVRELGRHTAPAHRGARLVKSSSVSGSVPESRLLGWIRRTGPAVIVSTCDLATQALSRLVRHGELDVPTVAVITDPGVRRSWTRKWLALHIAPLPETAARLCATGATPVVVAPPLTRPQFTAAPDRTTARYRLGLPDRRTVVIRPEPGAAARTLHTVSVLQRVPDLFVTVLCGADETLYDALAARPRIAPIRGDSDVSTHLAAADAVVENTGALPCWEALESGTPVVVFDPAPGRSRRNAVALDDAGVVRFARTPAQLRDAVRHPGRPAPLLAGSVPAERYVLALAYRGASSPGAVTGMQAVGQ
jgi:hypothetical protein